jgi:uncharacterized protein
MSSAYERELLAFREQKDHFFAHHPESPLTPGQRAAFTGLRYYPPNPELDLHLEPERLEDTEAVALGTSTGETATYLRWAFIRFEVDDASAQLTLFRDPGAGGLFLPFQDANAGGETYGAGRYLEPEELPRGFVRVDFNYAYNPYCAYNEAWSCPLPPQENRLSVAIRAGEMSFDGEAQQG